MPKRAIYDKSRYLALRNAAFCADRAAVEEIGSHSRATARNPAAAYEVRLLDACLMYHSSDIDGEIGSDRAWALMMSGNLNEALKQASAVATLQKNDLRFVYNYSRLLSSTGDTKHAFDWFSYAVKDLGFICIELAKSDPDLEAMRNAYPIDFKYLTTPRVSATVDWGVIGNDEVIIKNESSFPLHNATLNLNINTKGKAVSKNKYSCSNIPIGGSVKCSNASSASGNIYLEGSYIEILSDQNTNPLILNISGVHQ